MHMSGIKVLYQFYCYWQSTIKIVTFIFMPEWQKKNILVPE